MRNDFVVQEKGMTLRLVLGTGAMVVGTALVAYGLAGAPGTAIAGARMCRSR